MTHLQQIKLKRLRNDIQEGLDSGESVSLDMEEIKAEARKRRRLAQNKRTRVVNPPGSQEPLDS